MEKAGLKTVKNEVHKEAKGFYDAKERHFELYKDFQRVCIYQGQARVWELTEGGEVSKDKLYRYFNNEWIENKEGKKAAEAFIKARKEQYEKPFESNTWDQTVEGWLSYKAKLQDPASAIETSVSDEYLDTYKAPLFLTGKNYYDVPKNWKEQFGL